MQAGFAWGNCADVTGVAAAGAKFEHAVSFEQELLALSGGLIPPLCDLRFLSFGGDVASNRVVSNVSIN